MYPGAVHAMAPDHMAADPPDRPKQPIPSRGAGSPPLGRIKAELRVGARKKKACMLEVMRGRRNGARWAVPIRAIIAYTQTKYRNLRDQYTRHI